jgi:serine/threonine-protein kinase
MGEVFRAKDTRLNRSVAIKVLPAAFTENAERLQRFEREAQLLAQLHHPNIASIFGLEESSGVKALVMELVEGPTLSERLAGGALPLDEALAIARQIAEALEEAHEKGIVHRDLKPQNVKVTPEGKVKVLDFGLAKAMDPIGSGTISNPQVSVSPTMSLGATAAGVILGTAAYMSPEQAKGMAVDRRADVWAFGVVLWEMLAGGRLFEGPTVAETLAHVLTRTPDPESLPPATPAAVKQLLRRCLERNPRNRLHDIADARIALDELARESDASAPVRSGPSISGTSLAPRPRATLPWAVAAAALLVALGMVGVAVAARRRPAATPRPLRTFGVLVPDETALPRSQSPILDLSRDGRALLFVSEGKQRTIFWRSFDSLRLRSVAGTVGAEEPALSPDGRWIAFFAGGFLRKIPVEGGTPTTLAEARAPRGLTWANDGSVVFSPVFNSGLWRVTTTGGDPKPVTNLDPARKERSHRWPDMLPDGKTVLFTVGLTARPGDYDEGPIDAVRLDTGERRTILEGARMARWSPTGHLVFQRRESLMAVAFDPGKLKRLGEPFTLQENAGGEVSSGSGYFSVRAPDILAFAPENAIPSERVLVLVDRNGKETEVGAGVAQFNQPHFSPDGKRIAFAIGTGSSADDDVFVHDLASGRTQRLTFGQGHGAAFFSPDGRRIYFVKGRSGDTGFAWKPADGSGSETQIVKDAEVINPGSWLPDGRHMLVTNTAASLDIDTLDVESGTKTPLYASPAAAEYSPSVSPDGRFVAYASTESGVDQVFVETVPKGGGKWQISTDFGGCPLFSRDGKELYYVVDETIMVVDVDTKGVFRAGTPHPLFTGPYELRTIPVRNFDVAPDGRFVLVKRRFVSSSPHEIVVVDGWTALDPARAAAR